MSSRKRRLSVYLTDEMYSQVEKNAEEMGLSMSGVAILALYQFNQQNTVIPLLPMLQELAEKELSKSE